MLCNLCNRVRFLGYMLVVSSVIQGLKILVSVVQFRPEPLKISSYLGGFSRDIFLPAFSLTGHSRTQEPDFKYPKWETFFGKPLNGCAHLVLIPIPLNRIIINEELLCLSKSLILIQRTSQVHEEYCG